MHESDCDREKAMQALAEQLMFTVEKQGSRYSLRRDSDLSPPVCADNLTLDEAEELLQTWKLRGFHGG